MSRETPEQRAERITAELRDATREAAGVLKDLQATMKAARAQVDEYLGHEVDGALAAYNEQIQHQLDVWSADGKASIVQYITNWTAVVHSEIARTRIVREAADQIIGFLNQVAATKAREVHPSGIPVQVTWDFERKD